MTRNSCGSSRTREQSLGPFELFVVGWMLILSETAWFFKSLFRLWEIRQLKKVLIEEYIRLGRLVCTRAADNKKSLDFDEPEIDLALGQIGLLKEEAASLENELTARRELFVNNRRQKYLSTQDD